MDDDGDGSAFVRSNLAEPTAGRLGPAAVRSAEPSGSVSVGPPVLGVVLAFAAVYLIWGSTYLAIKVAVETIPPWTMASTRFLIAFAILFPICLLGGAARPSLAQIRHGAWTGLFMIVGGNGLVTIAETVVPSGVACLIVTTNPLTIMLLDWLFFGGRRLQAIDLLSFAVGSAGVALLLDPKQFDSTGYLGGALAVVIATICWGVGSLSGRRAPGGSPFMATALQMGLGGLMMLPIAGLSGEWGRLDPSRWTAASIGSLLYLAAIGSVVAFCAYNWLLANVPVSAVSTYPYVNSVVAVLLGWLGGEPLSPRIIVAALLILGAVLLATRFRPKPLPAATTDDPDGPG